MRALRMRRPESCACRIGCSTADSDGSLLVYGSYQERKITDADRQWWAFKKPVRATPPHVSDARWSKNPIDGFVKAKPGGKGSQRQRRRRIETP